MGHRTKRINAIDVKIGDVIAFSNGNSLTVAAITREDGDDLITFAGTMTSYSFNGNTVREGWCEEFWDDQVTVIGDKW
jgi:predicted nucleotidyltransferase